KTIEVPVRLSAASSLPVSVGYVTRSGTAVAGMDYQGTGGSVTFMPGERVKMVPVRVMAERFGGGDSTFRVVLTGAVNGTVGTNGGGFGRVAIRDGLGMARPTVTVSNATALAGDVETFAVKLSKPTTR